MCISIFGSRFSRERKKKSKTNLKTKTKKKRKEKLNRLNTPRNKYSKFFFFHGIQTELCVSDSHRDHLYCSFNISL